MTSVWNGRHIASPKDIDTLETMASKFEFHDGHPRETADAMAYKQYKQEQHAKAAAHHLDHARAAVSSGNRDAADRHNTLYALHIQALGHRKSAVPPPEVRQHLNTASISLPTTGFREHGADKLLGS